MKKAFVKLFYPIFKVFNLLISPSGYVLVSKKNITDFVLHEYDSYEQYREIQIFHNIRKIKNVWADAGTMDKVAGIVRSRKPSGEVTGICHGTRNGFEQNYLNENHEGFSVFGTDISDTAKDYANSVVWDFHDVNPEWVKKFDFVYSNSLDQSWKPKLALMSWLNQTNDDGVVVLEHTESHGARSASKMDPFGVRPTVMPYVLAEWFGHQVSVSFIKGKKSNTGMDVWLYVLKRNVDEVR